ncbi:MAG: hypothetical protein SVX43_16455 [Cyanobacteriota bacterium]|nr:hypothetical protein [Cyanobacteriota bacterium]
MAIAIETSIQISKPGAKPGQIILAIDLTQIKSPTKVLSAIEGLGYSPKLRLVEYASGVHALAILKDEKHQSSMPEDYLEDEWMKLQEFMPGAAVHLWRGKLAKA